MDLSLFPLEWAKQCMATYEESHGKKPKLMVVSNEDYIGYLTTRTLPPKDVLGIEIITGDYLNRGEVDFAMGTTDGKY